MPLNMFSVLMSVYNKENPSFFDMSLKSVLVEQTLLPDEFVLICDGELTDELELVIRKYQVEFPVVFKVFRKEHGGLGNALNFGLTKCSNNIVARADSDDISDPNRFQIQMSFMTEHPDVSVLGSYIDEFENDWHKPHALKQVPLSNAEIRKRAKLKNPMNHMSVVLRKDSILSVGSYIDVPYVEDYHLWVRAMLAGYKFANLNKCLVHARVGNGMIARRSNIAQINSWRRVNKLMLSSHFVSVFEYIRNILAISLFVRSPLWLKGVLYKSILREEN